MTEGVDLDFLLKYKIFRTEVNFSLPLSFSFMLKLSKLFSCAIKLSLDTAGAVTACKSLNFINGNHVVVALNGVLEARSRNCEFNCILS